MAVYWFNCGTAKGAVVRRMNGRFAAYVQRDGRYELLDTYALLESATLAVEVAARGEW